MKRLVASVNLIAYRKAFSDEKIVKVIECLLRAYLAQIDEFCRSPDLHYVAITSDNTRGPVNKLLKESRLGSKEDHLNQMTVIENYERKFHRSNAMKDIDDQTRDQVLSAFENYLRTIPEHKKSRSDAYQVKDIVARVSTGIGSAGRVSYNLLLQGKTQALESDVILFMKPATQSAVATALTDAGLDQSFQHDGLRTVLCAYAMHAVTSKWLGYTTLNGRIPMLVDEVATHNADLEWENVDDLQEVCQTVEYLGKAMGKTPLERFDCTIFLL